MTVAIATRNRAALCLRALDSVYAQDYPELDVSVLDDASDDDTAACVAARFPAARVRRVETNQGLIVARNALLADARGAFAVSLDDDAWFASSDAISRAVARLREEPRVAVFGFRLVGAAEEAARAGAGLDRYTSVFPGGAHCLRLSAFAEAGGYRALFVRQGEESDLALRLIDRGYRLVHSPGAVVVHEESAIGRDPDRILRYRARNNLLRGWLNEPLPWAALTTANTLVKALKTGRRHRRLRAVLGGIGAAFAELPGLMRRRAPVSRRALKLYLELDRRSVTDEAEIARLYARDVGARELLVEIALSMRSSPPAFVDRHLKG